MSRIAGSEVLALLDAQRLERVDHQAIALQPGLILHDAVEVLEEARIVTDGRVEDDIPGIRENGCRRIVRLRERIDLYLLAVSDRLCHVAIAVADQVRADQRIAAKRV